MITLNIFLIFLIFYYTYKILNNKKQNIIFKDALIQLDAEDVYGIADKLSTKSFRFSFLMAIPIVLTNALILYYTNYSYWVLGMIIINVLIIFLILMFFSQYSDSANEKKSLIIKQICNINLGRVLMLGIYYLLIYVFISLQ